MAIAKMKLFLFLLTMVFAASALSAQERREIPKLSVQGSARLEKPADQFILSLGVVTIASDAQSALKENSTRMQNVIENLKKGGLDKSEFQTGQFRISPTYTPYPKNPPPDWKATINGYEVTNTIVIKSDKIDQAGKIIDVANQSGANTVGSIEFGLKDPSIYQNEVIRAATDQALAQANSLADAAKVKLVRILSIALDDMPAIIQPSPRPMLAKMAYNESAPPIEAGDVQVTAHVSLSYEIADK
jgi:uncharacterized protein YggE